MARYLTTTLPYVNADPHIGFALEIVQADAYARTARLQGEEVVFNTGTDEHGSKIFKNSQEAGQTPQEYADRYANSFSKLREALNLSYDRFIRTTDPEHVSAAQEFWRRCETAGDIYKKAYQIKYCVGCELEKTDSELIDGHCILHPNLEIEYIDEENYFFRFSAYADKLKALYSSNEEFLIPQFRLNEFTSLIDREGLQDFSISRVAAKMPWGVPVPGDESQVMYVWFDALVSYISTIGWPADTEQFEKYWPVIQFAGKDQVRQQAAMWQAMLMSAGLPASKQIFIHGFITSGGAKMSKSLGNTVDPIEYVEKYGTDAVRYFLLRHIHPSEDSDFTAERFEEAYTANLVNGIGNLVARVMKLAEEHLPTPIGLTEADTAVEGAFTTLIDTFSFNEAMDLIWAHVGKGDEYMATEEPFKKVKVEETKAEGIKDIEKLVRHLAKIAAHLVPVMPVTAEKILNAVRENKKPENLFPRI
ncbi:MAG: metG [Parcubacteria group bacterium]|nr:metG [Parcubacteria group bacterium]